MITTPPDRSHAVEFLKRMRNASQLTHQQMGLIDNTLKPRDTTGYAVKSSTPPLSQPAMITMPPAPMFIPAPMPPPINMVPIIAATLLFH